MERWSQMSPNKEPMENAFSPQYFVISKSEPRYELIKKQLLDPVHSEAGSSHFFIRSGSDKNCICRIRAGNESVLFYEILNHLQEGISDEDISEVLTNPKNSTTVPGYFYITPTLEKKLLMANMLEYTINKKKCES